MAAAVSGLALALVSPTQAHAASVTTWEKLAQCESSGNWAYQGRYHGGLQFDPNTWVEYGGTEYAPYAYQATKEQQIRIGEKVLAGQGLNAWPNCWWKAGLADDHQPPFPDVSAGQEDSADRTEGDFDGDGRDDVAVLYDYGREGGVSRTGLWIFSGSRTGLTSPKKVWDSGSDSWNWASSKLTVGDFNGDGKADIGVLYDMGTAEGGRNRTKLFTFTSNGHGFNAPVKVWDSQDDPVRSWNWSASKPVTGDFNHDGKADLAVLYDYGRTGEVNRTGLWTFSSNGSGFNSPRLVWDSSTDAVKSWSWTGSKLTVGDFNLDAQPDIGVLYDNGRTDGVSHTALWAFTGNGSGFDSPKQLWTSGRESWSWSASKPVSDDFDNDGTTDIAVMYDMGRTEDGRNRTKLFLFLGNGRGYEAPFKAWDSQDDPLRSWNWSASKPVVGDFTGIGLPEVGVLYDYGVTDGANRTGLWTFPSAGRGLAGPKQLWDSKDDAVKSWRWGASKAG
ncbi:transglycosylase family protein [Streptomyces sp. NBC_00539]|uniref:transglycosylase family protein n=1 Tax=Streptomyces sp. NBC_00539 TaxID=2975770 RepID=UPI002E81A635|nr:transglycosylase family protein [Streptomyces sp. NBC_00539]WUC62964.1 transglycosylase family protein [Streptomyces sp. NBC_00539]